LYVDALENIATEIAKLVAIFTPRSIGCVCCHRIKSLPR